MASIGSLRVFLNADTAQFRKAMLASQKRVDAMRKTVNTLGRIGAASIGALTAAAVESVRALGEQEKVEAKLGAVLKATGNAAGFTKDQLVAQADALQGMTTFSDEAIINTQALLGTFKEIRGDEFRRATESVLDLATVLGTEPKAAAIQLGKALNDPVRGVSALAEAGIQFTEQQREQIATLINSGETVKAQQIVLAELEAQFGGVARAQAETTAGMREQLIHAFTDLKQAIGGVVVELFNVDDKTGGATDKIKELAETIKGSTKGVVTFFKSLAIEGKAAFDTVMAGGTTFFNLIFDGLHATWNNIKEVLAFNLPNLVRKWVSGEEIKLPDIIFPWDVINQNLDELTGKLNTIDRERDDKLKKLMEETIDEISAEGPAEQVGEVAARAFLGKIKDDGKTIEDVMFDANDKMEKNINKLDEVLNPTAALKGSAQAFKLLSQRGIGKERTGAAPIDPAAVGAGQAMLGGIARGLGFGPFKVPELKENANETKKVKTVLDDVLRTLQTGLNVTVQATGIGNQ